MRRRGIGLIVLSVSLIVLSCAPGFSQESSAPAQGDQKETDVSKDSQDEIVTSLGTLRIGTSKEDLYKVFQEKDRIAIPHKLLNEEWVIFYDITTPDPNDTITFYLKSAQVVGWKRGYNPSPKNEGSPYEYNKDEKLDKWFFPKGESRWDGTMLTAIEWNMLLDAQKVVFLKEYDKELARETGVDPDIDINKYILALNHYSDTCSDTCFMVKVTNIIKELLESERELAAKQ